MRLLIVEDEYSIARDIEYHCRQILGDRIASLRNIQTLDAARDCLARHSIDLLLLDLNLAGANGFELLKLANSGSFHTIIISGHVDRALEAFEYGALDFLPKPFEPSRLRKAFDRYFGLPGMDGQAVKYLTGRKRDQFFVVSVADVLYFQASYDYTEAVLKTGKREVLEKSLRRLGQILPSRFFRIHRSYLVDIQQIASFTPVRHGSSRVCLKSGEILPLSRGRHKHLRRILGI
ncbi:MAG: response regulator transcription factor [Candidatus Aminicenantes bacterium]|nr:response regulator transcription factor [Candidatus Aminicenantes bacterium]